MAVKNNSKASVLYAIISNTIVLVLIGLFLLLFFHTNAITSIIKERINIILEIKDGTTEEARNTLQEKLTKYPGVIASSVKFVPSSDAGKILGHEIDPELIGEDSPFKNIITFNVGSDSYNDKALSKLKTDLKMSSIVHDVIYENIIIDNIKSNIRKVSLGIFVLNLFFLVLVIVIMYNTINLSLYADRWEIKTMEIIGARDGFIRKPYLKIASRIAITSFVISSLLLMLILGIGYYNSEFINQVMQFGYVILVLLILLTLSLAITIISTIRIVNNYLYREEEELYQ